MVPSITPHYWAGLPCNTSWSSETNVIILAGIDTLFVFLSCLVPKLCLFNNIIPCIIYHPRFKIYHPLIWLFLGIYHPHLLKTNWEYTSSYAHIGTMNDVPNQYTTSICPITQQSINKSQFFFRKCASNSRSALLSTMLSPLEMCAVGGLLGGALGRMFGGWPQFLFVFYRPDRGENVRS